MGVMFCFGLVLIGRGESMWERFGLLRKLRLIVWFCFFFIFLGIEMTPSMCENCGLSYGDSVVLERFSGQIYLADKITVKPLAKLKQSDRLVSGYVLSNIGFSFLLFLF